MTPMEWALGGDTGVSSMTICAVMTGSKIGGPFGADVPHDSGDFGRCYRLLLLLPEWRVRLHEMADRYPEWTGLVREWDSLSEMYEAKTPGMYERMRALIEEGRLLAGWKKTGPGCWTGPKGGISEVTL